MGEFCENADCGRDCPKGTECIGGQCCEPDGNGKKCKSIPTEDCDCLNGGTCNENGNTSACICPEGYEGNLCEKDVDECLLNPNICVNGICVNQPGTFKCYCEPGKSCRRQNSDSIPFEICFSQIILLAIEKKI